MKHHYKDGLLEGIAVQVFNYVYIVPSDLPHSAVRGRWRALNMGFSGTFSKNVLKKISFLYMLYFCSKFFWGEREIKIFLAYIIVFSSSYFW